MDEERLARIERVEGELARIETAQNQLEEERERALGLDEEYAGYVEAYQLYYNDEPLPIRRYYELTEELERIGRILDRASGDRFEALYARYCTRLQFLERALAA